MGHFGSLFVLFIEDPHWIQINLIEMSQISGVVTQGRGSSDGENQWVTSFKILYGDNPDDLTEITETDGLTKVSNCRCYQ